MTVQEFAEKVIDVSGQPFGQPQLLSRTTRIVMLVPIPSPENWLTSLLAGVSHTGTAITVGVFVACAFLATRCKGRCCEDEIFRPHVI